MTNAERDLREFQEFLREYNRRPDPEKLAELRWYLSEDDDDDDDDDDDRPEPSQSLLNHCDMYGVTHGCEFTSADNVRQYFTVANYRYIFGDCDMTQDELDEIAEKIIETRYWCAF